MKALRDTERFDSVRDYSEDVEASDFLLQGSVNPEWRSGGFANFLTYFPGGLLMAPAWRGNRWILDVTADVELIQTRSKKTLGRFDATSSYEVIHRSGNPLHFLGAALVVPGVIRGSAATWPQIRYRNRAYKAAYPDVWSQIADQVSASLTASGGK